MALFQSDRRLVSVTQPIRRLPLCLGLTLALLPLIAQGQPIERLITEAMTAHPTTRSAQAQQDSVRAGAAGARWQYWPVPGDIRSDSRSIPKSLAKPMFKAFGGAMNER